MKNNIGWSIKESTLASQIAYLGCVTSGIENLKADGLKPPYSLNSIIRSSFDSYRAYEYAIAAGIPKDQITLQVLVKYSDLSKQDQSIIERLEPDMLNWKIAHVRNLNDLNGFYACCIETAPDKVMVAYRGSENMRKLKNLYFDWGASDLGLLSSYETLQQAEVGKYADFLMESGILDKYQQIGITGHSLGGRLAEDFFINLAEEGKEKLFDKVVQCDNLDGPGVSRVYLKKHEKEINRVNSTGINKTYTWSLVGRILHSVSDKNPITLAVNKDLHKDNPIKRAWYLALKRHSTESLMFDKAGNAILGEQDAVSKGMSTLSKTIDDVLPPQLVLECQAATDWLFGRMLRMKEGRALELNDPEWAERFEKKGSVIGTAVHFINNSITVCKKGLESIVNSTKVAGSALKVASYDVVEALMDPKFNSQQAVNAMHAMGPNFKNKDIGRAFG